MSLGRKTLLIVGATMLGLFVLLSTLSERLLSERFAALEREAVRTEVARAVANIEAGVERLDDTTQDWAHWDDTYEYVAGRKASFAETNLDYDSLATKGVDVVAFFDDEGNLIKALAVDTASRSVSPLPAAEVRRIAGQRTLVTSEGKAGLLVVRGGVMAVAGRCVRRSQGTSPPNGMLVMGRLLKPTAKAGASGDTNVTVSAFVSEEAPPTVRAVLAMEDGLAGGVVVAKDASIVQGYGLVSDVSGNPAALVRVEMPRDIHAAGRGSIELVLLSLVVAGVTGTGSTAYVLRRLVLRRIETLASEVSGIGVDTSARVTVAGDDELAELGEDINGMLRKVDEAHLELLSARDMLGASVESRTQELRDSEARHKALVEGMADATLSLDLDGRITFVNLRTEIMTGRTRSDLLGRSYKDIVGEGDCEEIARHLDTHSDPDVTWTIEAEVVHVSGQRVPVELNCSPVLGPHRIVNGMQLIARDVTERKRIEAQLVHLASHDHLTSLFNRRRFEEELDLRVAQAKRTGRPGAVLWIDIDNFKDINDSLGHRAGDEVLIALAGQLRNRVRGDAVLARLGGDEFAILISDIDPAHTEAVAQRILTDINECMFFIDGHAIHLGASMGVVLFPQHGTDLEELLAKADVAMYFAKESGRGRLHVHEPDEAWHLELSSRLSWNERITKALREDSFVVYAQPVLDLSTNTINRYELLVRLLDEDGELIPPAAFLPTAERLGLIQDIDRWMVTRAIALLAEQPAENVCLDVNLSGKAFSDPDLVALIERELSGRGVDPARLGLEITETAAISDIGRAQDFIGRLKALGCRFALDDFGSGFSSFYYLKHLPIDTLKIDGAFIRGLATSEQDRHLVRALVELCRGLSMQATAEFVEDEDTLDALQGLGVDFAQGYHISEPRPVEELLQPHTAEKPGDDA